MPAIVWAPTISELDVALSTATGVDKTIGKNIRTKLASAGATYDERYGVPGGPVDTAKTAWLVAAQSTHEAADRACRYVESLSGSGTPDVLPFDPYSSEKIHQRCQGAAEKVPNDTIGSVITAHTNAVTLIYADKSGKYTGPEYQDSYKTVELPGGGTMTAPDGSSSESAPSVRALELELNVIMREATEWLTYVNAL